MRHQPLAVDGYEVSRCGLHRGPAGKGAQRHGYGPSTRTFTDQIDAIAVRSVIQFDHKSKGVGFDVGPAALQAVAHVGARQEARRFTEGLAITAQGHAHRRCEAHHRPA